MRTSTSDPNITIHTMISKKYFGAAALILSMLFPAMVLAQGGPPPDSPRGMGIRNFVTLIGASDDDLESVITDTIAPSLIEEKGDDFLAYITEIRGLLEGFASPGYRPLGPTTIGTFHDHALGAIDIEFSVEDEKPHRIIEIKLSGGAAEKGADSTSDPQ